MTRKQLEEMSRRLGYEPEPDDDDSDLMLVVKIKEQDVDPNKCLERILEAVADGDRRGLIEACLDMAAWLEYGGFMPEPLRKEPSEE